MKKNGKIPLTKSRLRSAISKGKHLLVRVDHRDPHMRRLRDCVETHVSDLGGVDNISHSERVLIGRTSMLTVLAEMQERSFALKHMKVKAADIDNYTKLINTLRRTLAVLGLQRRAKSVPRLADYLKSIEREREPAE